MMPRAATSRPRPSTTKRARAKKNKEAVSTQPSTTRLQLRLRAAAPPDHPTVVHGFSDLLLVRARDNAVLDPPSAPDWTLTYMQRVDDAFEALTGRKLYDWQKTAIEAIALGLDVTVIAPTGAGKTIPPIASLLVDLERYKMLLIISPLKDLQHDQVR
jgi:ATP-dependent helicase YprA (DUF1998 family)